MPEADEAKGEVIEVFRERYGQHNPLNDRARRAREPADGPEQQQHPERRHRGDNLVPRQA
jgi:hypothetical protein